MFGAFLRSGHKFQLRRMLYEYRHHPLCSPLKATKEWLKNRSVNYSYVVPQDWLKYKKSDTVFLFGSGPSVNQLTPEQWETINKHDSFGVNFVFLTRKPMTYFYLGYEPSSNAILSKAFTKDIRDIYKKTLWFFPIKCLYRLYHPRTVPHFFPGEVKLGLFEIPLGINLAEGRSFAAGDFEKTLVYRGSIGIGFHLIDQLGYKKIVLVGVDINTYKHFYDDDPSMIDERKEFYKDMKSDSTFDDLLPKKSSKMNPMEEYYYALNELYFSPKGVELYVSNAANVLSPRIPIYPEFK